MPSENRYKKSKAGYLLEIEEKLGVEMLPRHYYKMSIAELYEISEVIRIYGADEYKLKTGIGKATNENHSNHMPEL